jgi:hypothetical protein
MIIKAPLDAPGTVHHLTVRGMEKRLEPTVPANVHALKRARSM